MEPDPPTLRIELFGGFRLTYGGEPVTAIDTPRLRSLVAYLLVHRGTPLSRHRVAFEFWPDSPEGQALTNLRNLLYRLRHRLPDPDRFLRADHATIEWRATAAFELDVAEFENLLSRAKEASDADEAQRALEQAIDLYRGDLLPGLYEDWTVPERQRLRQAFERAMEHVIQVLEDQRDYRAAIGYARRLVRHDAIREASCRRLMRLQALIGDRAGALRTYHRCSAALERELGVEPSPVTRELYEQLLSADEAAVRPGARSKRGGTASPLVGRQDAWARLRQAWRRAAVGRPQLLLVSGEAGIGKTRLAEELVQWASRQGIATATARCYPGEGELAYAPVAAWLRASPLPALAPIWRSEISRVLPELLADDPELATPGPIGEPWERRRFFEALARAILEGDRPLLLFVDALQWCDRGTLEWLRYLLRFEPEAPLLVVGTCRPDLVREEHPLSSLVHALLQDGQLREMELGPLTRSETATLARNVVGREVNSAVLDCLYRETEGNPLFIVEAAETGLPDDVRELPSGGRVCVPRPLPKQMKEAILARIAQLSPLARSLAEVAATIGRAFIFDVLRAASDASEDRLVQGLDELWQRRIIREQGEDAYDFSHDKLREILYADLSEARRRLLHRRVARALEQVYQDDGRGMAGRIAAHYERADELGEAIDYYRRAAATASQTGAGEEAARYRRRASALEEKVVPSEA